MTQRGEHSSRRQLQRRPNNPENNSDIEGTAHRVASVTLNTESDSRTSVDMPMYPFRSKRRKKLPRRDKQQMGEMDVDEHQPPWKKLSVNTADTTFPNCKMQMDWEHGEGLSTGHDSTRPTRSALARNPPLSSSSTVSGTFSQLAPPQSRVALIAQQKDAALSAETIKRIELFLQTDNDKELLLDKVYRTSAIKQVLRRQFVDANVQIVKRGRGTVALKKL